MTAHVRLFSRRQFLQGSAIGLAATAFPAPLPAAEPGRKWRAAILGHTGKGNYGHGLDEIFNGRPDIEIVAVADPDEKGRVAAAAKAKAPRQYADYREMLAKERPQLVSVAPRWTLEHHAMGMAALRAGAHICMEKPFTTTLAEADELLAVADQAGLKIAVAHQMRLSENVLHFKQQLDSGLIGELLELHAQGKQDRRAGGEDMMVLGTHLFHLMRFFAGDALWCTARVLWQGRDIGATDARPATEGIGLVAGDEIFAQFAFAKGVNGTFTSSARRREVAGPWGIEFIGSKGMARLQANIPPRVQLLKRGSSEEWTPVPGDPTLGIPENARGFPHANARVVDDWLDGIRTNREPACGGHSAMKAVEMVMAVYEAALRQSRVPLPLANRRHPLQA